MRKTKRERLSDFWVNFWSLRYQVNLDKTENRLRALATLPGVHKSNKASDFAKHQTMWMPVSSKMEAGMDRINNINQIEGLIDSITDIISDQGCAWRGLVTAVVAWDGNQVGAASSGRSS